MSSRKVEPGCKLSPIMNSYSYTEGNGRSNCELKIFYYHVKKYPP